MTTGRIPDDRRQLAVYLNDHVSGATSGVELSRRAAATHAGAPAGPALQRLAEEIAEDRTSLIQLIRRLDLPVRRHRMARGWLAEKASRLKSNGRLLRRSPLSDLLEAEALRMGVEGKRSLWNALLQISDLVEGLDRRQLERLAARATNQSELLDTVRNEAARRSLTKPEPPDTRTPRRPHRV